MSAQGHINGQAMLQAKSECLSLLTAALYVHCSDWYLLSYDSIQCDSV